MKAIVVHQPWASLIALGHKSIETRPSPPNGEMRPEGVRGLPGLAIERGERIAIVAGKKKPPCTQYEDGPFDDLGDGWQYGGWDDDPNEWWLQDLEADSLAELIRLPLGAVVCTVTVEDTLVTLPLVPPIPPRRR